MNLKSVKMKHISQMSKRQLDYLAATLALAIQLERTKRVLMVIAQNPDRVPKTRRFQELKDSLQRELQAHIKRQVIINDVLDELESILELDA